ncbi:hypothetical protein ACOMHN_037774 [Nucella lapillus]
MKCVFVLLLLVSVMAVTSAASSDTADTVLSSSPTVSLTDAHSSKCADTAIVKRAALADYKKTPSERNLQILRAARNKVKQKARRCATKYWTQLSDGIPPDLHKHCKSTLQLPQHEVLS